MQMLFIDWIFIIEKAVLVLTIILVAFGIAAYATWAERKVAAVMQDRIGPLRAGPFGLLQPLADGGKLFFKEEIIPDRSTKWIFILAPALFMVVALLSSVITPWGPSFTMEIGGVERVINLYVADINVGVLFIFAILSVGLYGIMLGGWASNNKFSLLASIRAASQAISYELAFGLSLIALVMVTGTLSLREIVEQQAGFWKDGYFTWNAFKQPLGVIIFFVCSMAELGRAPFDMPESEAELNTGYLLEYSSMKMGMFMFSEYINLFFTSVLISSLYFGGYNFPFMDVVQANVPGVIFALICVGVLMTKAILMVLFIMAIRWTLPRFRFDQVLKLGWTGLIPLALVNLLITAAIVVFVLN